MRTLDLLLAVAGTCLAQSNMCGQYEGHHGQTYLVQKNLWGKDAGSGSQCSAVHSISDSGVAWSTTWQWSGADDDPKSYSYSALNFDKKPVRAIGSMQTSAHWTYSRQDVRANVAYDLFTDADVNHSNENGDYELMVWLARLGDIHPIGSYQRTVQIGGQMWEFWSGLNGNMRVYSFVAPSPIQSYDGDLKNFFNYLVGTEGFPSSQQSLITFEFGTEPFTGGSATFDVAHWSANVA